MSTTNLTFTSKVHFTTGANGRRDLRPGPAPVVASLPAGRVPKLSRLMALAIRFDGLLKRREVRDMAELARLGHVSRARVTQVMNLLCLAPDLQEQILFWPLVTSGHDALKEWQVRQIAAEPLWDRQRRMWRNLVLGRAESPYRLANLVSRPFRRPVITRPGLLRGVRR
jgi:hypothetical protein